MAEHAKRLSWSGALFAILLLLLLTAPGARAAEFGVGSFSISASTSQAGAHADITSSFALRADALGNPIGRLKDVRIELPEGVVGNPQALEKCSFRSLETASCRTDAQIGTFQLSIVGCHGYSTPLIATAEVGATELHIANTEGVCTEENGDGNLITIGSGPSAEQARISQLLTSETVELAAPIQREHAVGESVTHIGKPVEGPLPLFNLVPFPGHVATFGTFLLGVTILVQADVSPDGNLVATIEDASTSLPLAGGGVTLWGFPGDPRHDPERCNEFLFECGASAPREGPLVTLPTECSGQPLATKLTMESWHGETVSATAPSPALTGCSRLSVEPSLQVRPETTTADSPSGYEVGITVPQNLEPYGLGTPALKDIALTLPAGTSLSPAFAEGLGTCSDAAAAARQCPNAARIGSAEVITPLLDEPLKGSVYFGTPTANVRYPLVVQVAGSRASIQLSGRAVPDPRTGQVTAIFEDAPQLPFNELNLHLFGGSAAALDNPQACGPATSSAAITAYGGASAAPTSSFTVASNCGTSFSPGFLAGSKVAKAAAFSPFSLTLTRADGEPDLGSFATALPPGLTGLLRSVDLCGEPQAATGACPAGSAVGTATVGLGAGSSPLSLTGPVFLTGPYGDAPFGLDVLIHAAAGPVDLGDVVVRSRLYVEPKTLALKIVSDALPQIVGGIPLRMRSVTIALNKPGLILNPSTCQTAAITGTAMAASGAVHALSTPFGVLGCSGLRFAPRVSASTGPGGSLKGKGAGLRLRIAAGGATKPPLRTVSITLPGELRPRLTTIQQACLPAGGSLDVVCGERSIVGTASIVTPTLAQPLSGNAYVVAHGGGAKPTLALLLHGGGITQQLEGALTISKSNVIRANFAELPDIPIDELNLALPRGPHSLLGAVAPLCGQKLKLAYALTDQGGQADRSGARIAVKGCGGKRARR